MTGLVPVWEHIYYLQYKNVTPDYVKAIYKVANWMKWPRGYKSLVCPTTKQFVCLISKIKMFCD